MYQICDEYDYYNRYSNTGLLELNLQLFAKEGPGGEKTEPATEKKLSDARKEGQVAKSKELGQAATLFAFFILLKIWSLTMGQHFIRIFAVVYNRMSELVTLVNGEISVKDFCSLINYVILRDQILSRIKKANRVAACPSSLLLAT